MSKHPSMGPRLEHSQRTEQTISPSLSSTPEKMRNHAVKGNQPRDLPDGALESVAAIIRDEDSRRPMDDNQVLALLQKASDRFAQMERQDIAYARRALHLGTAEKRRTRS